MELEQTRRITKPVEREARARGRPKVRSDDAQRASIIACSLELFLKRGYAATSTSDIAAECQISKRTLYRFFASKTDLFAAMVARHRDTMMVFPDHDAAIPVETQLETMFQIDIGEEDEQRRAEFIRLAVSEGRQFPELGEILRREGGDRTRQDLANWLETGQKLGRLDIGNPEVTAGMLMDLIFGAMALKTGWGTEWPGGLDRIGYVRYCIRSIINGLKPRSILS